MTDQQRKRIKALAQEAEGRRLYGEQTTAIRLFTEAIELAEQLKIDHKYAWAYAHRGAARAAIDDWTACCEDFGRAVELREDYGWAYAHWGDAHRSHASYTLAGAKTPEDWREQHTLIDRSIHLFDKAASLSPGSAWTFAHRGAAYTYKYWIEVMPRLLSAFAPEWGWADVPGVRGTEARCAATQALKSFERACELNPRYAWAFAFKACLLALIAREQPDMKAGLLEARACLLEALVLDVNKRLLVDRPIAELLSCAGHFPESVAAGLSGVEKNPWDVFSRYFVAVGLKNLDDPLAPQVIRQTRKVLESVKSEINTMLHGLNVLEGGATDHPIEILKQGLSFEALALMAFDPTWRDMRELPVSPRGERGTKGNND
ncbi:tetratricopeptide repeat protein [Sorangium sp. So ce406]|uniref:tetratricopeptide repeat protein n=1 Tax=Sorangium sp. So ce406 TaxID=3133311 RepID=UPI003F5C16F1